LGCEFLFFQIPRDEYELAKILDSLDDTELEGTCLQIGPLTQEVLEATLGLRCKRVIFTSWGSDLLTDDGAVAQKLQVLLKRNPLSNAVLLDTRVATRIIEGFGVEGIRIIEAPWGVDMDFFQGSTLSIVYKTLNNSGKKTVFVNRRHEPLYQIETVLRAVARQPEGSFQLLIAGEGSETDNLKKLSRELGLVDAVRFLGWLGPSETRSALLQSDIYINPSSSDGSSVSMLEAMASGSLVMASDSKGNKDWINESNGYLFKSGDDEDLGIKLASILSPSSSIRNLSKIFKARKMAKKRADWKINRRTIKQKFKGFLSQTKGRELG
jgi:glycosyltransferase involved in cell wall biosynthesis